MRRRRKYLDVPNQVANRKRLVVRGEAVYLARMLAIRPSRFEGLARNMMFSDLSLNKVKCRTI